MSCQSYQSPRVHRIPRPRLQCQSVDVLTGGSGLLRPVAASPPPGLRPPPSGCRLGLAAPPFPPPPFPPWGPWGVGSAALRLGVMPVSCLQVVTMPVVMGCWCFPKPPPPHNLGSRLYLLLLLFANSFFLFCATLHSSFLKQVTACAGAAQYPERLQVQSRLIVCSRLVAELG